MKPLRRAAAGAAATWWNPGSSDSGEADRRSSSLAASIALTLAIAIAVAHWRLRLRNTLTLKSLWGPVCTAALAGAYTGVARFVQAARGRMRRSSRSDVTRAGLCLDPKNCERNREVSNKKFCDLCSGLKCGQQPGATWKTGVTIQDNYADDRHLRSGNGVKMARAGSGVAGFFCIR
jgi:hypothetical protein